MNSCHNRAWFFKLPSFTGPLFTIQCEYILLGEEGGAVELEIGPFRYPYFCLLTISRERPLNARKLANQLCPANFTSSKRKLEMSLLNEAYPYIGMKTMKVCPKVRIRATIAASRHDMG